MSGYFKKIKRSNEAALKYVIYGAASSGLMFSGFRFYMVFAAQKWGQYHHQQLSIDQSC